MKKINNDRGIALITALIISVAVMVLVTGILFFIIQSTNMSAIGKRYATASEAADGAIELVAREGISRVLFGDPRSGLIIDNNGCFTSGVLNFNVPCPGITVTLPGTNWLSTFTANVTIEALFSHVLAGSRIEFGRSGGGVTNTTARYTRITVTVTGAKGTSAENTAIYRVVE